MIDLVLRNGHVIDPSQELDGRYDVAISGGKIAAITGSGMAPEAARVLDVSDALVVPGLVDIHAHVYPGANGTGLDPDETCLPNGVTTAVDGGTSGSDSFAGFKRWIADAARTRVFAFVNLSAIGLAGTDRVGELANPGYIDPDGTLAILREHPDLAIGIKVRVSAPVTGGPCVPALREARRVADEAQAPIMVHIGDSEEPLGEVLSWLRAGDIVSHCFTWRRHGLLDDRGRVLPEVIEARERGVLFDPAHGVTHFCFATAERLLEQGFLPDTISSDLSNFRRYYPGNSMPAVLAKFLRLGMSVPDMVRLASNRPAEILGRADCFGSLKPGLAADIAVFRWQEGEFELKDSVGETRTLHRLLVPHLTVRDGEVIQPAELTW